MSVGIGQIFFYFSMKTYIVVLIRNASVGTSNECSQHMFLQINKKKYPYFWIEKNILSKAMGA